MTSLQHPLTLTAHERAILGKRKITRCDRAALAALWEPFQAVYLAKVRRADQHGNPLWAAFRFCAQMMLTLDCTYWAFTWDQLLAWREATLARETAQSSTWRRRWERVWTEVAATLFFLDVLPYRETIYKAYHQELAAKWLGQARATAIEDRFVEVARAMGYQHERQVRKRGVSVLLAVMAAAGKQTLEELTKADFDEWEAQTSRSPRVAMSGVTMAQRVLGAMGYLKGEAPRTHGGAIRHRFTWGRTAPQIVATLERFIADFSTTHRPSSMTTYIACLRRFGDWLGEFDPQVTSVAQVRRHHIEAYKQAVSQMTVGDYVTPVGLKHIGPRRGQPFSRAFQVRCISCLKTFFDTIEALEYPERPGRPLFVRGDIGRLDHELPRFIPDRHWHALVAEVERLTVDTIAVKGLPQPYERTRAILAILLEAGLRAGELCRLDTGCIVTANDSRSGQVTHWLRVPVGKLHNDRLIPIRASLIEHVDAWMRKRGPQPLLWDERTNQACDFLFTWLGGNLSQHSLSTLITTLCQAAGVPRYTSHQFRHTLAVQWRKNGMRIETISRMLGHTDLKMTLRYAAVMPETMRREFDTAFAAIGEEYRTTAQVRVLLSPETHVVAQQQWRESLWVDLGMGFCGLSAYLPCQNRLACLPCPHFVPEPERLPLYEHQRQNLLELRLLGEARLPAERQEELDSAVKVLDGRIAAVGGGVAHEASPLAGGRS